MWSDAMRRLRASLTAEDGSMTLHGLFMFTTCCIVAAAGLDTTHFFAARSQLQAAADASAHAAIYRRHLPGATDASARSDALALARAHLPPETYGSVVSDGQVEFGQLDASGRFVATSMAHSATRVTLGRTDAQSNPVQSFFFRLVGVDDVDVITRATFAAYRPGCLSQGFVANGRVDMQSNNDYYRGFCIHSNDHVELNSNNWFEYGTVVSMPDTTELTMPGSGWVSNEGIADALRQGSYDLRILDRIALGSTDPLQTAVTTRGSEDAPSYITNWTPVPITVPSNNKSYSPTDFSSGHIYSITCSGNRNLRLNGGTYASIVIDTNCPVQMSGRVRMENMVLMTSNPSSTSVQTPTGGSQNGLELGRPDDCAPGFGAQIITRGGFRSSAALQIQGGQILALGDVDFAANAVGKGASIITNGRIDSTSNMSMSSCPTGMEDNFESVYFRMTG